MARAKSVGRLIYLDLFKTVLVYGMVFTHVVQLLGFGLNSQTRMSVDFFNLITFSGFMLAFGIGTGLSRKDGRGKSLAARLMPAGLLLLAYYISASGYLFLVEDRAVTAGLLIEIASLRTLFGWSEFLASFAVLYLLIAVLRPVLLALTREPLVLPIASAACLATTLVSANQGYPLSGTVVASTNYASFPILPYLPWFLIGMFLGQRGAISNLWLFLPAVVASGAFAFFCYQTGEWPTRFPPTALWVAGAALPLMVYLWVSQQIAQRVDMPRVLLLPGRHVLLFLVLTNLAIFAGRHFLGRPVRDWPMLALVTLGLIAGASVVAALWEKRR